MRKYFDIFDPGDSMQVVLATRKELAQQGVDEVNQCLIAAAVSELATNIVRYAGSGKMSLEITVKDGKKFFWVSAEDKGPGIADIEQALQEHFSTGAGLGLGLPSVKRIMDVFSIDSAAGQGTRIKAGKWLE